MVDKIQLINAPLAENYAFSTRLGIYPPLNLGTLAGYLKKHHSEINIEILDGDNEDWRQLLSKINAPIVGISSNIMTYSSAIQIAEVAFETGAKVIMGGPYPSSISEKILRNHVSVDAIVDGDGEIALLKYIEEAPTESIPNLVYRMGGQINKNFLQKTPMIDLTIPDYCNLSLEMYFANFRKRYSAYKPFNASLATFSRKGCKWRDVSKGGCIFCMIPHYGVTAKNNVQLWGEIEYYNKNHRVDYFWEVCDTFTEDDQWIKDFIATRPKDLDVSFQVYGRANHLTPRMCHQLKELGVYEVFMGVESGDDLILKNSNKGQTVEHTLRAIDALSKENIRTVISFVLGLPGESSSSLQKTVDLSKRLSSYDSIVETSTSIMLPIPGSNAFTKLTQIPHYKLKHNSDLLDLEELKVDWLSEFTNVTLEECEDSLFEITDAFPLNNSFSQKDKMSAPQC